MKLSNIFSRRNRILLRELVVTDFKLRYQGSVLGYVWSVLKPLFLFVILYFVFDQFMGLGRNIEHFPVYLLLGIVLWTFFAEATNLGLQSIVGRGDLIRKINFPKYIIVISGTISSLINLGINLFVVLLFMFINGVSISWSAFIIIPLVAELYILALALAFLLAALNVRLRDTGHIWEIIMQAAFYATPVIYPLQMVMERSVVATHALMLNPVAQIIQDARYFLITPQTITVWQLFSDWRLVVPFAVIVILLIAAAYYFKKSAKTFAEEM